MLRKEKGTLPLPFFKVLTSLVLRRKRVTAVERKGTSKVTQIVRQVQMKFGQVPPRVSKQELKTGGKEDQAKGKGAVRPRPRLEIAKDRKRNFPKNLRPLANSSIQETVIANGVTTAVTAMKGRKGERESHL
jgi:hypothetical protein